MGLFHGRREAGSAFSDGTKIWGKQHLVAVLNSPFSSILAERAEEQIGRGRAGDRRLRVV